jgi:hypothetical protein
VISGLEARLSQQRADDLAVRIEDRQRQHVFAAQPERDARGLVVAVTYGRDRRVDPRTPDRVGLELQVLGDDERHGRRGKDDQHQYCAEMSRHGWRV